MKTSLSVDYFRHIGYRDRKYEQNYGDADD